jgi:hypothetical protein
MARLDEKAVSYIGRDHLEADGLAGACVVNMSFAKDPVIMAAVSWL